MNGKAERKSSCGRVAGTFRDFQQSFYPSSGLIIENARQPKKKIVRLDPDSSMPKPGPSHAQEANESQRPDKVCHYTIRSNLHVFMTNFLHYFT